MTVTGLRLGAPGVYHAAASPSPAFVPVRLDVAGFVGVAPRGPVDVPVVVDTWSDYQWLYGAAGAADGPGLLGASVHAFFSQGGTRAQILRVSPLPRAPAPEAVAATAVHRLALDTASGPNLPSPVAVELAASSEGTWGNRLTITCSFGAPQRFRTQCRGAELSLPPGVTLVPGSLLRIRGGVLPPLGGFRWVELLASREDVPGLRTPIAMLNGAAAGPPGADADVDVDVVTATVVVTDTSGDVPRQEQFGDLGLRGDHPAYLPDVLAARSRLVAPAGDWPASVLPPGGALGGAAAELLHPGEDRWEAIGADSFVGDLPTELLPLGGVDALDPAVVVHGADRMSLEPAIGLLVVPDLLWDVVTPQAPAQARPPRAGPRFAPCPDATVVAYPAPATTVSLLDGRFDLDEILRRQLRLVALAERQCRFVTLLDVPPRLPLGGVPRWRARFDSSYAAAYHPWLGVVAQDDADHRVRLLPPSAFAAGIIATREHRLGIPWGPAGDVAAEAVTSAESITDTEHDALHLLDIDVFRAERDGFRLTAAHTLTSDPDYRQLSVRRLMTMLRLVLQRQAQWVAFEPHTAELRGRLRLSLIQLLRDLARSGAFRGATEEESFFVQCDDALNPSWSQAQGRLVADVGVSPAQPLEFLVLRVTRDAAGALDVDGGP